MRRTDETEQIIDDGEDLIAVADTEEAGKQKAAAEESISPIRIEGCISLLRDQGKAEDEGVVDQQKSQRVFYESGGGT